MKKQHTLIIGGTGMLRPVAVHFAEKGHTVSVVARNIERLRSVIAQTQKAEGLVNMIPVDYHDTEALKNKVYEAIAILGPITLAIGWIHDTAPEAAAAVAGTINDETVDCRYFDILSTKSEQASETGTARQQVLDGLDHIDYRRVILGSVTEGDSNRWLTNEEIVRGVMEAIDQDLPQYVVGSTGK